MNRDGGDGGGGSSDSPALAVNALSATGPVAADSADQSGELLLTRLSVTLASDATIEQLNAAIVKVGATGIGYSKPGSPYLTLIVPRQDNGAKLVALAQLLQSQPGILFAAPGRQMSAFYLPMPAPASPQDSEMRHLLTERFPAAWNAAFNATGQRLSTARNCSRPEATVIIVDFFQTRPADTNGQLAPFIGAQAFGAFNDGPNDHGWQVAATLASAFDEFIPTGAIPLTDCIDFVLVDISGLTYAEIIGQMEQAIAAQPSVARLIVNLSFGFGKKFCGPNTDSLCSPENLANTPVGLLQTEMESRLMAAIQWSETTNAALDERMLLVQAAGNENAMLPENGGLGNLYPGIRQADLASFPALATQLDSLSQLFSPDSEAAVDLWTSEQQPSLLLDHASFQFVQNQLARYVTRLPTKANMIVVGSATNPASGLPEDIAESSFSNEGSAILAVGEDIVGLGTSSLQGTSFAAPQVSGLVAYLWAISDLEDRPASETATHIKFTATSRFLLDAYAATLALDVVPTLGTVGIREALMDVNGDDKFDELDLQRFAEAYGLNDPNTPTIPESRDYSRFDLNGDGATGGIPTAAFDLDRGAILTGLAPLINTVDRQIEGYPVTFNEAALSDIQILCYYAYSTLYANDNPSQAQAQERTAILGPDRCVFAKMYTTFPAQISGPASLDVKVEVPAGNGQYAPAPNMLVTFTPSCGSVSPTSGRTDADGNIAATVTPTGCTSSVSVTAIARANEGTTPLAQKTVTATVGAGSSLYNVIIAVGQPTGTTTAIVSDSNGNDSTISAPIGDTATVIAQVNAALGSVSSVTWNISIRFYERADVTLNAGGVAVGRDVAAVVDPTACGSVLNLTVGDIGESLMVGGCADNVTITAGDVGGNILVGGTNANINISVGTVDRWVYAGGSSSTVNVNAQAFSSLSITGSENSTINIQGTLKRLSVVAWLSVHNNSNLTLGPVSGEDLNNFYIFGNSFTSSPLITVGDIVHPGGTISFPDGSVTIENNIGLLLNTISMGDIDGNLRITGNKGFSDTASANFADARTIGGTRGTTGNTP